MALRKYRYSKKLGKMIEVVKPKAEKRNGPFIMGDIKPYKAVGPEHGTWITSRSKHREYLKRHNLIEVGNEKAYITGEKK